MLLLEFMFQAYFLLSKSFALLFIRVLLFTLEYIIQLFKISGLEYIKKMY